MNEALPSTAELLVAGGDDRIRLDPVTHRNKYGCGPRPEPGLLDFASSTASVISERAYAAADALRGTLARALHAALDEHLAGDLYAREMERLRQELLALAGLTDLPGLDVVFAASGTEAHLLATQLVMADASARPRVVMVEDVETGSGVRAALAGLHFGPHARGPGVEPGEPITGRTTEVLTVPIREPDGQPRDASAIRADVEALVDGAIREDRPVLLVGVDVSKTGLVAPAPADLAAIQARDPERIHVLVDACQWRLTAHTLRAYLAAGFLVALTGSKFLTGPSFSGALLVPRALTERLRSRPLPGTLAPYSARAEWPAGWTAAQALPNAPNFGLALRWQAALAELAAFNAVPDVQRRARLDAFARAASSALASRPELEPLAVPTGERGSFCAHDAWDRLQTIFPFVLRHLDGSYLTSDETRAVYLALRARTPGIQLGQPVAVGRRYGVTVSALRLCASARHAVLDASQEIARVTSACARAVADLSIRHAL